MFLFARRLTEYVLKCKVAGSFVQFSQLNNKNKQILQIKRWLASDNFI